MRLVEVCNEPIRTVAVSPDGRFVAAGSSTTFGVFHWATGEPLVRPHPHPNNGCTQFAFAPDGSWIIHRTSSSVLRMTSLTPAFRNWGTGAYYAGGVAVSPDGKLLVATVDEGGREKTRLHRWALPALRAEFGFDYWPPFQKLAYSSNGEYIAGIWPGRFGSNRHQPAEFELRFARSGGKDFHYPPFRGTAAAAPGFVSFSRDSDTCAFGWADEFHIVDTSTGTSRYERSIKTPFRDASFTGSGQQFATVEDTGVLKLWDVASWQVAREYDWDCGALTSLAFTADGSAGVCGTADGRLVQFDVDE